MTSSDLSAASASSIERTLTQADFDAFAHLSGDDNAIHVDPAFCARTRFGRTVAHGLYLASLLHAQAAAQAPGLRLVQHDLMFPAPTFAGDPMAFSAQVVDHQPARITLAIASTRVLDGIATCTGHMVFAPDLANVVAEHLDGGVEPLAGRLGLGDCAHLCRVFTQDDLAQLQAMTGAQDPQGEAAGQRVPPTLIGAMFSRLLGVTLPGPGTNYLKQETQFPGEGQPGEPITALVQITRLRPDKGLVDLACRASGADGRVLASGRALVQAGDTGRVFG